MDNQPNVRMAEKQSHLIGAGRDSHPRGILPFACHAAAILFRVRHEFAARDLRVHPIQAVGVGFLHGLDRFIETHLLIAIERCSRLILQSTCRWPHRKIELVGNAVLLCQLIDCFHNTCQSLIDGYPTVPDTIPECLVMEQEGIPHVAKEKILLLPTSSPHTAIRSSRATGQHKSRRMRGLGRE